MSVRTKHPLFGTTDRRHLRTSLIARRCGDKLSEEPPSRGLLTGTIAIDDPGVAHRGEAVEEALKGPVLPFISASCAEIRQGRLDEADEVVAAAHRGGISCCWSPGFIGHHGRVART